VKNIKRIAAATAIASGLGLAGVAAASVAEAAPAAPFPDYHWCPGQFWDPGWGNNFDWGRCHDDYYFDGEPHDRDHWHGQGDWRDDRGGPGWDNRGPGWDNHGGPGWDNHGGPGWNGR
jgi:hypothetical protein